MIGRFKQLTLNAIMVLKSFIMTKNDLDFHSGMQYLLSLTKSISAPKLFSFCLQRELYSGFVLIYVSSVCREK